MFNRFLKGKEKRIIFYSLIKRDEKEDKFLTICASEQDAEEYAEAYIKTLHYEHFNSWCKLRNLNIDSEDSWLEYYLQCISDTERSEYVICEIRYKLEDIASMLRMFGNCCPLNCSFETEAEYKYFYDNLENNNEDIEEQELKK